MARTDDVGPRLPNVREVGRHLDAMRRLSAEYLRLVEPIKEAKRRGELEAAEQLLLRAIEATEREAEAMAELGWPLGVAPWYYEQLAIVYRKQKRYAEEVSLLERYERQMKAPGAGPSKLAQRLARARVLLAASGQHDGKMPRPARGDA